MTVRLVQRHVLHGLAEMADENWEEHNTRMVEEGILDEQDVKTAGAAGGIGGLLALLLLL